MKLIPLTQGKFAQVDDEDYEHLMQWKWCLSEGKGCSYAMRRVIVDGVSKKILMHRLLLGLTDFNIKGDHKDRNGLNNQKSNLRVATQKQNSQNRTSRKNSTSKFLGVSSEIYYRKSGQLCQYWNPTIYVDGKQVKLGRRPYTPCRELLSAIAYDVAAEKFHGEFANLNFKRL